MSLHIQYEIILADFNLEVSTLTDKLPNLIPRQIFRLYGTQYKMEVFVEKVLTHGML